MTFPPPRWPLRADRGRSLNPPDLSFEASFGFPPRGFSLTGPSGGLTDRAGSLIARRVPLIGGFLMPARRETGPRERL
jgi:hypothetical protein